MKTLFLLVLLLLPVSAEDLVVKVSGVRNAKGFVRGMVYKGPDGFPENAAKAVALAETRAATGEVVLRFKDVEAGVGAVVVLHDENNDKKMQKNLVGIPREGVGASNWDHKGRPKYQAAMIEVGPGKELRIRVKYY